MVFPLAGLGAVAGVVDTVINKIWPDKSEQEKQELAAAMLIVQGQLDINKEEAKNSNVFVSGWRPAIGWVCVSGCAWNWVLLPVTKAVLLLADIHVELAAANMEEMLPLLLGLLGIGGLRTVEKIKKVA